MEMQDNKMGVMPVKRLIINMALPMMISMLVQALYNVVDSIFVAMIEEDALTAVTLAFPMQNLMIAVGSGTGVGINALLSKALGEKDTKKASKAANVGLFLTALSFAAFLIIGIFGAGPFIASQTESGVTTCTKPLISPGDFCRSWNSSVSLVICWAYARSSFPFSVRVSVWLIRSNSRQPSSSSSCLI